MLWNVLQLVYCLYIYIYNKQAKEIFEKILPNEDFLPRAPDSDEIIMETEEDNNNQQQETEQQQNDQEQQNSVQQQTSEVWYLNIYCRKV